MGKNLNLFDLLLIFAKQKRIIISITIITAIASVVYSLLTPSIWTSRTSFKPDVQSSGGLPISIPGLGDIMSSFMGSSADEAQNAIIILRSRTLNEDIIHKFNLIPYLKIKDKDSLKAMDEALLKVKTDIFGINYNEENGLISIKVSTKDKQLSLDIANYYLTRLDQYNREQKVTKGKLNRQFLESRVAATRQDIDSLALALKNFQKKNKAIDITTQMSALVSLYSDVVSQKMIADIELEMAKQNYNTDSPLVKELTHKKQIITNRISDLEKSSDKVKPSYLIDIDNIPELTLQYTQLMINLEIQKKVFEYLYPQYEAAKIEELRDMPSIEIIDMPRKAGMRSHPKRAIICVIATLTGFILALGIAYLKHQAEQNRETMKQIKDTLFPKK
ncbi:MAG: hypothetical protein FJ041_01295 [Candidatus Cloacimonetes bacterium]|nr:hypothetical protein [Candidatus Cloacimonadota bacterium]